MAETRKRSGELEALADRVRQATTLIGRLKKSNLELSAELDEVKRRLVSGAPRSAKGEVRAETADSAQLLAQLKVLRQERQQIREKISRLLRKLDEESGSS
jgi:chromosome segregation ATPase